MLKQVTAFALGQLGQAAVEVPGSIPVQFGRVTTAGDGKYQGARVFKADEAGTMTDVIIQKFPPGDKGRENEEGKG